MTEEKDIETIVLEDDADMNDLLRQILQDEGIDNCFLYTTSKDVFAKLNPNVRVLVVDLLLPNDEFSGAQVMDKVREQNPGCYVIIVTQFATTQMVIQLLNAKADWFIEKNPNYIFELVEVIKKGRSIVHKRDALLHRALESYNRIEKKHNDGGSTD